MARRRKSSAKSHNFKLEPVLDLRAAAPLADQFSKIRGGDVAIDASEVERVGALCVQVLLSAKKTWAEDGNPFSISEPSDQFLEALECFGLSQSHFQSVESQG